MESSKVAYSPRLKSFHICDASKAPHSYAICPTNSIANFVFIKLGSAVESRDKVLSPLDGYLEKTFA